MFDSNNIILLPIDTYTEFKDNTIASELMKRAEDDLNNGYDFKVVDNFKRVSVLDKEGNEVSILHSIVEIARLLKMDIFKLEQILSFCYGNSWRNKEYIFPLYKGFSIQFLIAKTDGLAKMLKPIELINEKGEKEYYVEYFYLPETILFDLYFNKLRGSDMISCKTYYEFGDYLMSDTSYRGILFTYISFDIIVREAIINKERELDFRKLTLLVFNIECALYMIGVKVEDKFTKTLKILLKTFVSNYLKKDVDYIIDKTLRNIEYKCNVVHNNNDIDKVALEVHKEEFRKKVDMFFEREFSRGNKEIQALKDLHVL